MLKKIIPIILTSTIIISSFSFSTQAQAKNSEVKLNQKNQSEIQKILKNLKEKDPQKLISQKLKTIKNNENELISEQNENFQIKFELQNKKIQVKNKQKGNLTIGIPNSEQMDSVDLVDNKVIYSGQNSKSDVILESVDGGFRQIINIKDSTAPNFYDFPVELNEGEKLELTENGGAIVIGNNPNPKSKINQSDLQNLPKEMDKKTLELIKSNQIVKTTIGKPWAKDSNGKDLKTSYSVENGNILRQKIDLKDAVFPVVADPIWCGKSFYQISWENRPTEGGWTLKISPNYCGRGLTSTPWLIWDTFQDVLKDAPASNLWSSSDRNPNNQTSKFQIMWKQYYCHADIAFWKENWNIEPWRQNRNWWETYNSWQSNGQLIPCNPN